MSDLSDLLSEALRQRQWTARQLAREAQKRGHHFSEASATAYAGGRHGTPSDATIAALVDTLDLPESRVRAAVGLEAPGEPWEPPELARYLSHDQRDALARLIVTMVDRESRGDRSSERAEIVSTLGSGKTETFVSLVDAAARKTGQEPRGRQARREQDEADSGSQDDQPTGGEVE